MADQSPALPEVLANNPPLLKAAQAALRQIKTSGRRTDIEANKLRQAIAQARALNKREVSNA